MVADAVIVVGAMAVVVVSFSLSSAKVSHPTQQTTMSADTTEVDQAIAQFHAHILGDSRHNAAYLTVTMYLVVAARL